MEVGPENSCNIHLTLIPYIKAAGELKTKPTQHSVMKLREIGLQANVLLCRCEQPLTKELRDKIGLFCNVPSQAVIEARDVESIYEIPVAFEKQGLGELLTKHLHLDVKEPDLSHWEALLQKIAKPRPTVTIAICGKYVNLHDSYKSIIEAFKHAGVENGADVKLRWIDSEKIEKQGITNEFENVSGLLICPGFGRRGIEGKIAAARYARENKLPFLGICLGMQCAVIDFARNVCGLENANSAEFDDASEHRVIDLMENQTDVSQLGGTMRLGAYKCRVEPNSKAFEAYKESMIHERHRHRFEVNNEYVETLQANGMKVTGVNPETDLVEMIELPDHPWFVGVQFHPELKSRILRVHPLFRDFVKAAFEITKSRSVNGALPKSEKAESEPDVA